MIATLLSDPALRRILAILPRARVVGGAVRDAMLGQTVADIDLANPDAPPDAQTALQRAGLRVIETGISHGTLTALCDGRAFEITTLRRDVSTDGRHAEVEFTDDWQADAARRDFTINAMSLDAAGSLHDYFGGAGDLAAGRLRFIGDPATRIREDYLRILRFFRFFARYARSAPDPGAMAAISANLPGLARLSAERVWSELKKILAAPDPVPAVRLMQQACVLDAILPEGADPDRLAALLRADAGADPLLRLAALLRGDPARFALRLRLSNEETTRLIALRQGPVPQPDDDDKQLRRYLADEDKTILLGRTLLRGGAQTQWDELRARLAAIDPPVFPLHGRHALSLGATPGPALGEALRQTRAVWLAAGCTLREAELMAILRDHIERQGKEGVLF